jgi:hypothetical protein
VATINVGGICTLDIKEFIEGICSADAATVRKSIKELIQSKNEDLLIIAIRETLADYRLFPGSNIANVVGSELYISKPRRNILRFIGRKLSDPSLRGGLWLDEYLASNMSLSPEEFVNKWDDLADVARIRALLPVNDYIAVEDSYYAIPAMT